MPPVCTKSLIYRISTQPMKKTVISKTNFNPTYGWKQRKLVQLWAEMESRRRLRFLVSIEYGITKIATRITQLSVQYVLQT